MPAVAQMTKQGLLFMFHRLTGEPLFGVEERPVPAVRRARRSGVADAAVSREAGRPHARRHDAQGSQQDLARSGEVLHGAVRQVGEHGARTRRTACCRASCFRAPRAAAAGAASPANPALGLVFVNTRHLGVIAQLQSSMSSGVLPSFGKQKVPTNFYVDQQGYPCNAPPWSELVAVSSTHRRHRLAHAARRVSRS